MVCGAKILAMICKFDSQKLYDSVAKGKAHNLKGLPATHFYFVYAKKKRLIFV
jgi:hypothetical protein